MRNDAPNNSSSDLLSREGTQRREHILRLAQRAARVRRRARRAKLGVAAVGVLALCASVIWFEKSPAYVPVAPRELAQVTVDHPHPLSTTNPLKGTSTPARPLITITRIKTEVGISERLAVRPQPRTWRRLTDDELLLRLSQNGRAAALAQRDGKEVLVLADGSRPR